MKRWTKDEKNLLLKLKQEGFTNCSISERMRELGYDRTPKAIEHACEPLETIQRLREDRDSLFQMKSKDYKNRGYTPYTTKILSISDLHIPYVNDSVLEHAMVNHGDADTLVVNGDFWDMYDSSKWGKSKSVSVIDEYRTGVKYFNHFSSNFNRVLVNSGNHDDRPTKKIASTLDSSLLFATHPDLVQMLCQGYDIVKDSGGSERLARVNNYPNVKYSGGAGHWFNKVGKCIFAHPSGGSKIPMRLATNTVDYFIDKVRDFDCVVIGHTHRQGKIQNYRGKLVIEQGCCCSPQQYEANPKMQFGIQSFGYAVVYMDNAGNIDLDRSGPVYFGSDSIMDGKNFYRAK